LGKYARFSWLGLAIKPRRRNIRLMVESEGRALAPLTLHTSRRIARAPIKPTFCFTKRRRVWTINFTILGE
jgi:hypothetical protein